MDDWFVVAPSSIIPGETKSLGLYSKVAFEKGAILPGCYSGTLVRSDDYTRLIDEIDEWHQVQTQTKRRTRKQAKDDSNFIKYLFDEFGLIIEGDCTNSTPKWDRISLGLTDYSYEGEDNSENEDYDGSAVVTILQYYDFEGKPIPSKCKPPNFLCFANEPPNTEYFFNKQTGRQQLSCVNITAVNPSNVSEENLIDPRFLHFKAKVAIEPGDELFLSYGASYEREYPLNMTVDTGCGQYSEINGYLKPEVDKHTYETLVQTFGSVPLNVLSDEAKTDKRVVKYFQNVIPSFKKRRLNE